MIPEALEVAIYILHTCRSGVNVRKTGITEMFYAAYVEMRVVIGFSLVGVVAKAV